MNCKYCGIELNPRKGQTKFCSKEHYRAYEKENTHSTRGSMTRTKKQEYKPLNEQVKHSIRWKDIYSTFELYQGYQGKNRSQITKMDEEKSKVGYYDRKI